MFTDILSLLVSFLQVGLFSIGGGYATLPFIQKQVVDIKGWLTTGELTDMITLSQMTPGPLAVNISTFVGVRIAGIGGAAAATAGCTISGIAISLGLYRFFLKKDHLDWTAFLLKGLKSASVGLIAFSAVSIFQNAFGAYGNLPVNLPALLVFGASFFLLRKYKMNPITLIILTGVVGLFVYY